MATDYEALAKMTLTNSVAFSYGINAVNPALKVFRETR